MSSEVEQSQPFLPMKYFESQRSWTLKRAPNLVNVYCFLIRALNDNFPRTMPHGTLLFVGTYPQSHVESIVQHGKCI
jgi:hypothetical protein